MAMAMGHKRIQHVMMDKTHQRNPKLPLTMVMANHHHLHRQQWLQATNQPIHHHQQLRQAL
jgi:hypothetical protein